MARHADQIEIECRWCGRKKVVLRSYYNAQKRAGNTPAYCNRTHFVLDSMGSREKFLRLENLSGFTFSMVREPGSSLWLGGFGVNGAGIRYAQGETFEEAVCVGALLALGGGF